MFIKRTIILVAFVVTLLSCSEAKPRDKGTRRASKAKRNEMTVEEDSIEESAHISRSRKKDSRRRGEARPDVDSVDGPRRRKKSSAAAAADPAVVGKSAEWGFVFSWHQNRMNGYDKSDYRWSSGHIGHKNEFKVALLGLREAHPLIPIYLFTNIEHVEEDISELIDVIHVVDLLKEGGLDKIVKETGDLKFGFATKAQSLITGWERNVIPDKVIHLDVDIAIVRSTQYFNLEYAIEPLQYYDIAGVMEGYSSPLPGTTEFPAVGRGWEMNTGVFAIKRSTAPLLRKWIDMFVDNRHVFVAAESGEQQAFMMALQHNPEYRLFPLPAIYNFRRASIHPRNGPDLPVLLHSHTFGDDRANESNWKEIAKHASQIIFEDCYHHMTMTVSKYRYLCDILVT